MSDQPAASSSTAPSAEFAELSIAGSSSTPAPAPVDDAYNGDLPDFSDDDTQPEASSSTAKPRKIIGPGSGRKIISKLKGRAPPPGGAKPKVPAKANKNKALPAVPAQQVAVAGGEDDEEEGTLEMNEEMLAMVMEQLKQHGANGQLTKEKVQAMVMGKSSTSEGKKLAKDMDAFRFWSTQPVPRIGSSLEDAREGPLEPNKAANEIPSEPVALHSDFKWVTIDLTNKSELDEVVTLLGAHYVEDAEATFRFDYPADFLEWALRPPGYIPDWHVGIRVAATGKLVGFISGIPLDLRLRSVTKKCTEINFLVVHKKLRAKRLAPLLIQEVTRRTHQKGIFQAVYTAGAFLPTPIAKCQYYHRSLNPAKLVKTGFSAVPRNSTVARMINQYKRPDATSLPGLREMEKKDLKEVARLLRAYLARFEMAPLMSNKEVEHALLAGRGKDVDGKRVGQVTWTYVVEDPQTKQITDMFSFYTLPSTAVQITPHTVINAAYLFYSATTAAPSCANLGDGSVSVPVINWKDETKEQREVLGARLKDLMGDALTLAAKAGFDVVNALTLQDNVLFLEDLKFGKGNGFLHYYLYNYSTKLIAGGLEPEDNGSGVGLIML